MNSLLEISCWFLISFFWILAVKNLLLEFIPKHYLTWWGGVSILIAMCLQYSEIGPIFDALFSTVPQVLYYLISIPFFSIIGLLVWYTLTKLVPTWATTYIGFSSSFILLLYPLLFLVGVRYQINDWHIILTNLLTRLSLQKNVWQWLTEVIIPVSIPISIALWGWWNQKEQTKISEQGKGEENLKNYFDEISKFPLLFEAKLGERIPEQDNDDNLKLKRFTHLVRMKTLWVLQGLDNYTQGKRRVIQFLIENQLKIDLSEANLAYADLSRLDLTGVKLNHADLRYSNLDFSNLSFSDLQFSNLDYSSIQGSNCRNANLTGASLRRADLSARKQALSSLQISTDLTNAVVVRSNFSGANLENTIFVAANLDFANLRGTNLVKANLRQASLENTKLRGAMTLKAALDRKYMTSLLSKLKSFYQDTLFKKKNDR